MLYDTRWDAKTDPLTLDSLIAWLETMPARKKYDFNNCEGACLMGQYMAHVGMEWNNSNYAMACQKISGIPSSFMIGAIYPRTFGAALKRAKAAFPSGQGN